MFLVVKVCGWVGVVLWDVHSCPFCVCVVVTGELLSKAEVV